jgi:hypothetical protein
VDAVTKAGTISIIGVYPETVGQFLIGKAMGKNLTIKIGNCNHRRYIPHLLELVRTGAVEPRAILTQVEPLMSAIDAYKAFDRRQPGWIKVELLPAKPLGGMSYPRFRARVRAAFRAARERAHFGRAAAVAPPRRPPLRAGARFLGLPRPAPDFRPPPVILLTVAQARRSASGDATPRSS